MCGNAIVSITSLPKHHTTISSLKSHFNITGDDSLFNLWPFPPLSPALLGTVSILMIRMFALNIFFSAEWRENRWICQSFPIPCWTARPLTSDLWIDRICKLLGGYPVVACRLSAGLVQYGRQKPHTRTLMRESSFRMYMSDTSRSCEVCLHSKWCSVLNLMSFFNMYWYFVTFSDEN